MAWVRGTQFSFENAKICVDSYRWRWFGIQNFPLKIQKFVWVRIVGVGSGHEEKICLRHE